MLIAITSCDAAWQVPQTRTRLLLTVVRGDCLELGAAWLGAMVLPVWAAQRPTLRDWGLPLALTAAEQDGDEDAALYADAALLRAGYPRYIQEDEAARKSSASMGETSQSKDDAGSGCLPPCQESTTTA